MSEPEVVTCVTCDGTGVTAISEHDATLVDRIVQRVAELPDRASPDDWPEAMLVTADELRTIVDDELGRSQVKPCADCGAIKGHAPDCIGELTRYLDRKTEGN